MLERIPSLCHPPYHKLGAGGVPRLCQSSWPADEGDVGNHLLLLGRDDPTCLYIRVHFPRLKHHGSLACSVNRSVFPLLRLSHYCFKSWLAVNCRRSLRADARGKPIYFVIMWWWRREWESLGRICLKWRSIIELSELMREKKLHQVFIIEFCLFSNVFASQIILHYVFAQFMIKSH